MGAEGIPPLPPQETEKEAPSLERVLAELNKNGAEHPETLELVVAWTIAQENAVDAGPSETRNRRVIEFNIDRAQLYVAIGDLDEAENCLREAKLQTEQEGMADLIVRIEFELKMLKGESN